MSLSVKSWNVDPVSNTTINGVYIGPNCPFAHMNDMGQNIMGAVKREVSSFGSDVSAGGTPDIGGDGGALYIVGVATVDGFATAPEGLLRVAHFETATPLMNSANLSLPGGASFTTKKGDVGSFRSLGSGAWKCEHFTRVDGRAIIEPSTTPTGAVIPYAGSTAPADWLFCYGQAISRTTYANLFAAIGTAYGVGDGSTTFNLPDLRGRVAAALDNLGGSAASRLTSAVMSPDGNTLGATGGTQTHTLTEAQIPSHTHALIHSTAAGGDATHFGASNAGTINSSKVTEATGGGTAHLNTQPTILLSYIIKT